MTLGAWPTGNRASTSPSARKTTLPVGVPEELVATAVTLTGLSTRAGLGKASKVTVGAEAVGCEVFTEIELGAACVLLLPKIVLVEASSMPAKLAVRLLCRPAVEKEVVT